MLTFKECSNYLATSLVCLGMGSLLLHAVPSALAQSVPEVYGRTDATRSTMLDPFSIVYVPGQSDNPHNIRLIHGVDKGNGTFEPAGVSGQKADELTFGIDNAPDGIQLLLNDLDVDNKQSPNGERPFASIKVVDADTGQLLCDTTRDGLDGITTNSDQDKFYQPEGSTVNNENKQGIGFLSSDIPGTIGFCEGSNNENSIEGKNIIVTLTSGVNGDRGDSMEASIALANTVITPTPVDTATPEDTATPVGTATPVNTATPEDTATPVGTATPVNTATPEDTATPTGTSVPLVNRDVACYLTVEFPTAIDGDPTEPKPNNSGVDNVTAAGSQEFPIPSNGVSSALVTAICINNSVDTNGQQTAISGPLNMNISGDLPAGTTFDNINPNEFNFQKTVNGNQVNIAGTLVVNGIAAGRGASVTAMMNIPANKTGTVLNADLSVDMPVGGDPTSNNTSHFNGEQNPSLSNQLFLPLVTK